MSEPLGCSGQITSGYCPDNMPLLMENVSEEARRANGKPNGLNRKHG